MAKELEFQLSSPNEYLGLISFRIDWLDFLSVQGTLKSFLQHHSSKASILWCSAFFIVQLSHPYMTTGKTIAFTRWTFAGKIMSLLLNMLSTLVITFLPKNKHLLISWLQSPSAVTLEPPQIFFVELKHFLNVEFKPAFSLSCFTFIKRLSSSSSLSAIRIVSSVCLRLLLFLPAILIFNIFFVLPPFEDNGLLFWAPDVLC